MRGMNCDTYAFLLSYQAALSFVSACFVNFFSTNLFSFSISDMFAFMASNSAYFSSSCSFAFWRLLLTSSGSGPPSLEPFLKVLVMALYTLIDFMTLLSERWFFSNSCSYFAGFRFVCRLCKSMDLTRYFDRLPATAFSSFPSVCRNPTFCLTQLAIFCRVFSPSSF